MTRHFCACAFVAGLLSVVGHTALAEQVVLTTDRATFEIDTDTLEMSGAMRGTTVTALARPALIGETRALSSDAVSAEWQVETDSGRLSVTARAAGSSMTVEIASDRPAHLPWPHMPAQASDEWALPVLGEGRLFEAQNADWRRFLIDVLNGGDALVQFAQPFWTRLHDEGSVTWRMDTPWDARLSFEDSDTVLSVGVVHAFTPLNLDRPYRMTVDLGPRDPVIGAQLYRAHLEETGAFRALSEKAATRADIDLLAGAPHIYLWSDGLLTPSDVTAWRRFVRQFARRREAPGSLSADLWGAVPGDVRAEIETAIDEAQGADGFVSRYSRTQFIRALNAALPLVRPFEGEALLPGRHDPAKEQAHLLDLRAALAAEFEGSLAPPDTWGGGMSLRILDALAEAGIARAWLGIENWHHALGHPEAMAEARSRGYLFGPYDSYASAHPEGEEQTWPTAQMGQAIFDDARILSADGSVRSGFRGIGVYVNPRVVADYAMARIHAVADTLGANSYFLDVDATGLLIEDYAEGRQTSKRAAFEALKQRLSLVAEDKQLVLGSEVGVAAFAPYIDFAHGITTPAYDWMDPRTRKDPEPIYHIGNYWPPEAPDRFFKPTLPPPNMTEIVFNPAYRIPLYQIALGDSVVTTHHWHFGTLKPEGQRAHNELIGLLYAVPPLYHLNASVLDRDLPTIADYVADFAPLHRRLMTEQMTGFAFLSTDRLLQQTAFADGTVIVANFSGQTRSVPSGQSVPDRTVLVDMPGADPVIIGTGS
ncbi:glycoside hydrolase [Tateyamaria omphalii]|uniref:glycoside hydrolase n=1 Tax=Tateyamaria omphalii TaxID=299262 RepID=UPI001C99EF76|nr:glycoside hydrolase [Tateyamaria omphalii]MBY5935259.1 glycoside hydrolase [Tateyamaria omphalii]